MNFFTRTQAVKCDFSNLHDSFLRDKIIFDIGSNVREKLLPEDNIDLDIAVVICWASEQANKQLREVQGAELSRQINFIKNKPRKSENGTEIFNCRRCATKH